MSNLDELQEEYDRLALAVRAEKRRLAREVEEQAWQANRAGLEALQAKMWALHREGVPKWKIKAAVRKAGDNAGFERLWGDGSGVDLRRKSANTAESAHYWDGTTFVYRTEEETFRLENFAREGDIISWDGVDSDAGTAVWLKYGREILRAAKAIENDSQ